MGSAGTTECASAFATTIQACTELGIPLAHDKTEGPHTVLSFLGVELNSATLSTSFPRDKLQRLKILVDEFTQARTIRNHRRFESLIGHLVHASKVCPLGKAFMNALFAVKACLKPGQIRRLNREAQAELSWWSLLLTYWPGTLIQQFLILRQPDRHLYTDASGSWGCGAWCQTYWFQLPWECLPPHGLHYPEGACTHCAGHSSWGPMWRGSLVMCHCDNAAVVSQVNRLHAKDRAHKLLYALALLQALYDCRIRAVHRAKPTMGQTTSPVIRRRPSWPPTYRSLLSPRRSPKPFST